MKELVIRVPDLGGVEEASVIEISAHVGDVVGVNDPILVVESEKASMEIPAGIAGRVKKIMVAVGDKIKTGSEIAVLIDESATDTAPAQVPAVEASAVAPAPISENKVTASLPQQPTSNVINNGAEVTIHIPDLGGVETAQVIEIPVKVGDELKINDTMLVLESDKASMEIPSTAAGTIERIIVNVGDKVSSGASAMIIKSKAGASDTNQSTITQPPIKALTQTPMSKTVEVTIKPNLLPSTRASTAHAGPAVRKLAREFGIDLHLVKPSGPRQRIVKEDLHAYVKQVIAQGGTAPSHFDVPSIPKVDFAEFGQVEIVDVGRIKKLTAINMHRNWVRIPHVTQFDEADISELEVFRKSSTAIEMASKVDIKLTALPFIIKATALALRKFPQFNASLEPDGQRLVLKKYCHIGFAVDTDEGLFVPVIRDADKKTIWELAQSTKTLSEKARTKKLLPNDMKGGCFTISSLGGVGGTAFTPIINAPEVAILGVSKASIKPVYINNTFEPRTLLPLSLSYDHRIIDGAEAARFTAYMASLLADVNQLT